MVPIFFGVAIAKRRKQELSWMEAIKDAFRPTSEWCPKDPIIRKQYQEFLKEKDYIAPLQGIDNPAMGDSTDGHTTIKVDEIPQQRY